MTETPPSTLEQTIDQLRRLELDEQVQLLDSLPLDAAGAAFNSFEESHQGALLSELAHERAAALFAMVPPTTGRASSAQARPLMPSFSSVPSTRRSGATRNVSCATRRRAPDG
jgi:hypothetical protein